MAIALGNRVSGAPIRATWPPSWSIAMCSGACATRRRSAVRRASCSPLVMFLPNRTTPPAPRASRARDSSSTSGPGRAIQTRRAAADRESTGSLRSRTHALTRSPQLDVQLIAVAAVDGAHELHHAALLAERKPMESQDRDPPRQLEELPLLGKSFRRLDR